MSNDDEVWQSRGREETRALHQCQVVYHMVAGCGGFRLIRLADFSLERQIESRQLQTGHVFLFLSTRSGDVCRRGWLSSRQWQMRSPPIRDVSYNHVGSNPSSSTSQPRIRYVHQQLERHQSYRLYSLGFLAVYSISRQTPTSLHIMYLAS